jgi:nuclear transcription factor Y gamma
MEMPFDHSTLSHSVQTHMAILQSFWQGQLHAIEQGELDFKTFQLPLARIKKVMKTDEDVKMISAEAPIIFAKACEIFVLELTLRAWIHTEENKRRTLQRNDVAAAVAKTDTFDFLIDIVPREESRSVTKKIEGGEYSHHLNAIDPATAGYYYAGPSAGSGASNILPGQSGTNVNNPYGQVIDTRSGGMDSMMFYQQQQAQQLQYIRQQQMLGNVQDPSVNSGNNPNMAHSGGIDYSQNGYVGLDPSSISEQHHL